MVYRIIVAAVATTRNTLRNYCNGNDVCYSYAFFIKVKNKDITYYRDKFMLNSLLWSPSKGFLYREPN